jgi:multidrug resistance efflux pump
MRPLIFLALTTLRFSSRTPDDQAHHRHSSTAGFPCPATLAPWQQATLHAKVTGYIATITVDKGDAVKAGQVLATLEVPELQADIAKSKAEVTAASIEVKRLHEARAKSPDLVLPQAVDDAEAKLAIAKAGLERSETQIQFATLKAPFDGIITAPRRSRLSRHR